MKQPDGLRRKSHGGQQIVNNRYTSVSTQGYVYVLVNSTMPGLIKIGRTNRDPSQRALELSRVTGVATPFVVAYEKQVSDSVAAEQLIHNYLGNLGCRVADNREFFQATAKDAIDAILALPDYLLEVEMVPCGISVSDKPFEPQWLNTFRMAKDSYEGRGDTLRDNEEAYRLFKLAASQGCHFAFAYLADMHFRGEGCAKGKGRELYCLKEGFKLGNRESCAKLMQYHAYEVRLNKQLSNNEKSVLEANIAKCFKHTLLKLETDTQSDLADDEWDIGYDQVISDLVNALACAPQILEKCDLDEFHLPVHVQQDLINCLDGQFDIVDDDLEPEWVYANLKIIKDWLINLPFAYAGDHNAKLPHD